MKNVVNNIIMLYGLSIAKMIFPLITLPYLTRVLTVDSYGTVAYIKTVMQYMQLIIDFGFIMSGTKDIVENKNDKAQLEYIIGDILIARLLLVAGAAVVLFGLVFILPILKSAQLYTLLSFVNVALTIFLFDYVFRGIEKMHLITIRFVLMKTISTMLTFIFVKADSDILWIPILDILGTTCAVILILFELKKNSLKIKVSSVHNVVAMLKKSCTYFISDFSTTAFGALNTVLVGVFLLPTQVAYWSICIQLVGAVQSMYQPITGGIYPEMIRTKSLGLIKHCLKLFMPIIIIGCIFTFCVAKYVVIIVGGYQYADAYIILRYLTPLLAISFPAMLIGWPVLGAISKAKEVTFTTIVAAFVQIAGLIVLIWLNKFSLISIAIVRCISELSMLMGRMILCIKYKNEFN